MHRAAEKQKPLPIQEEGNQKLELIRQRVLSGFYSGDLIADDLSEKLSNVLDNMT